METSIGKLYKSENLPVLRGVVMAKKRATQSIPNGCVEKEQKIKSLRAENRDLKETLKSLSSTHLIKQLKGSLEDLKHGRYRTR